MQRVTRAVILTHTGDSPALETGPANLPLLQPKQVLVRMEYASISSQDLTTLRGTQQGGRSPPTVPGFEGSGTVIETGSRLKNWRFYGKRVAFFSTDLSLPGSWSEYVVVPTCHCFLLDDDIPFEQAACLFLSPLTVCQFEEVIGKAKAVVQTSGASSVGKAILRLCNYKGIACVHIVPLGEDMATLRELGAKHLLSPSDPEFPEKLTTLCEELSVTIGLDCYGGAVAGLVFNALKPTGTLYVYEDNVKFTEIEGVSPKALIFQKKTIVGLNAVSWFNRKNAIQKLTLVRHIQTMHFLFKPVILATFPVEEVGKAVEVAKDGGNRGKVLLQLHAMLRARTGVTEGQEGGRQEEEKKAVQSEEAAPNDPDAPDDLEAMDIPAIPQLPDIKSLSLPDAQDGDEAT